MISVIQTLGNCCFFFRENTSTLVLVPVNDFSVSLFFPFSADTEQADIGFFFSSKKKYWVPFFIITLLRLTSVWT